MRPVYAESDTVTGLPVDALLPSIVRSFGQNPLLVLEAPPGAGKTTRVPPALVEAGFGEVLVLEPRRLAARLAARRVASERGEPVGQSVGYQVRFEQVSSARTRLRFLTEGVLTRRLLADPDLVGVGTVVLDEFHERHLEGDLALALLLELRRRRPDLRLVVMSATIEGGRIAEYLDGCPVARSEGRLFDTSLEYTPESAANLEQRVARAVRELLARSAEGDILVFLPGAAEIRRAQRELGSLSDVLVLPLYGDLSPQEQDRAVAPAAQRKVILSTNVAESSITIEGVRMVVDSGLARVAVDSTWSGLPRVEIRRISRASARQRAGRAGRTGPGRVVRLYTEADFLSRPEHDEPEIARRELAQFCLDLHAAGLRQPLKLRWLDEPPAAALVAAETLLRRLGALRDDGSITSAGRAMAALPLHPRLATLALAGGEKGMAAAAALASGDRFPDADLISHLERMPSQRARQIELQLQRQCRQQRRAGEDQDVALALLRAFPDRVARRRKGNELLLSGGASALLAAEGHLAGAELLVAAEIEERPDQGLPLVRLAARIEPEWLLDLFPERVSERSSLEWNRAAERVEASSALLYDELVIDESRNARPEPAASAALLARKAVEVGLQRFADPESVEALLNRARFAAAYFDLPGVDVEAVLGGLCRGLRSFAELKDLTRDGGLERAILQSLGPRAAGELARLAPERVELPSGRKAKVHYPPQQKPWVASRLQDFFGLAETPKVAAGRVALVVHLLAPSQRPLQMTEDLAGFWQRLYPQLRKELSRRYPRHRWPENPYNVYRE